MTFVGVILATLGVACIMPGMVITGMTAVWAFDDDRTRAGMLAMLAFVGCVAVGSVLLMVGMSMAGAAE